MRRDLKVGVVGTCGTGKSELVTRLVNHGFDAHHIAQEHSFNPQMWRLVTNPDLLVYLQVSYNETLKRKNFDFSLKDYNEQLDRLEHAKNHADIKIDTTNLNPDEVFEQIMALFMED
jgi:deoxyadenosine/deoxycytidine kinase